MRDILPIFEEQLLANEISNKRETIDTVQINNGKLCNLACLHCHVEAGPKRTELMDRKTTDRIIELLASSPDITTVDITGGAPEMNPLFKEMVRECRKLGKKVMDRCNLTIFFEDGYRDIPEFLAENEVHIVASLPCYSKENVDKQRGRGTFNGSIEGLIRLNALGYGKEGSHLKLDLVYNPTGANLPPPQENLEKDYKKKLYEDFEIEFHNLFTITNMPIKRYERQLKNWGKLDEYMDLLVKNFNPQAASRVMCKNLISISWEGEIFDCDFNQMLELPVKGNKTTVWDIESFDELASHDIIFDSHCYGCTAGSGSSCGGALT